VTLLQFEMVAGSANGIFVSYRSSSVVQLIVRTSSTNALIFQRIGSYPSGKNKIAVAYKNGDFAISLNGTAAQVNTSSITMPTSLDSVALFGDNLYAQTLPVPYAHSPTIQDSFNQRKISRFNNNIITNSYSHYRI
jgi:hypothetical protein